MRKNKRFIDCYMKWIITGNMPNAGLCNSLPIYLRNSKSFRLIYPPEKERQTHHKEGGHPLFWGTSNRHNESIIAFTSLRQTIVLLCAVMEGEKF